MPQLKANPSDSSLGFFLCGKIEANDKPKASGIPMVTVRIPEPLNVHVLALAVPLKTTSIRLERLSKAFSVPRTKCPQNTGVQRLPIRNRFLEIP